MFYVKQTKFVPQLSNYLTLIGSIISISGALIYVVWTWQGTINSTEKRVAVVEANENHLKERLKDMSISLQRQEDKIDKIYVIISEK